MAYGGSAFGLEGGDGGGNGGADRGVDALDLAQPGDVLGGGDRGVGPQGQEGDDRHHQQADDLGAHGAGAYVPPILARGCLLRRGVRGCVGALVGRWTGVRAATAHG